MEKITFPYDPVNRIQKIFYDYDFDDIPTIYNKNKLLKTKTKLIKYWKYCMQHVETALTPQIDAWDKQFKNLTEDMRGWIKVENDRIWIPTIMTLPIGMLYPQNTDNLVNHKIEMKWHFAKMIEILEGIRE